MSPAAPGTAARPAAPAAAPPSVRRALAALSLSMLLPSLGISIANVALPTLAGEFSAPFAAVQWVVLAFLLATTTTIVGAGRLGDVLGRRRLLLGGILLYTVASLLCGTAPALGVLIAARAAQGLGAAVMLALTMAFVGATVPQERTGRAMGLLGTMSAVGTALGPSLGGLLIAGPGWRTVFLAMVPLGGLALLLAYRHLPPDRPAADRGTASARPRPDRAGTLLLALALAAYALAMTVGRSRFGTLGLGLLGAAGLGAVLFVLVERRAAAPLVRPAMFRDGTLSASLAMSALVSTVMMATLVVGPFYLSRALGLPAAGVGLVMSVGPLVTAVTGVPAGRIVDRFGTRRTTAAGLTAVTVGCLALCAAPASLGTPGYLAPVVLLTVGYATFQTANNTGVMADVPADRRGVVSGVLNLSRNLGLITGTAVMGAVFAAAAGTGDPTTARAGAVATALHTTFAVAAVLTAAALVLALATGRTPAARR
ncbi:MFS transporter [Streptomyces sp. NRRL B-24484]|uniref:MFS transporter n=1 Tax=Streptomyces sp. NRRL B-24484 TaxID=1463833 RepID=UPI0004C24F0F|nr:MFS transporter [Streptomyces sp. NRRL B-24484]